MRFSVRTKSSEIQGAKSRLPITHENLIFLKLLAGILDSLCNSFKGMYSFIVKIIAI